MARTLTTFLLIVATTGSWVSCRQAAQDGSGFSAGLASDGVSTGAQQLIDHHLGELDGLRVGLVMNPTARIGNTHMLDTLLAHNVTVTALFAPEHGFRGEAGDGELIANGVDSATGLPVHSLYGQTRKPTSQMLETVDLLLFDMQDVGARFYTYNSTLGLLLEAASEADLPVWVLDRPNPAGGNYISGWTLEESYKSFVGMYPLPVAHGLTLGELGQMMIGERWINFETDPRYRVIPMEGWRRDMLWPQTGLSWVPPSPNLPTFEHAYAYLGTCFIEGTSLSEGRGIDDSFLTLGSPGTDFSEAELSRLRQQIPGASLEKAEFRPEAIPGRALSPKHEGQLNRGIHITITDYEAYDPVETGLRIMTFLLRHSPEASILPYMYQLAGNGDVAEIESWLASQIRRTSEQAVSDSEEPRTPTGDRTERFDQDLWWTFDSEPFRLQRAPYLIYD